MRASQRVLLSLSLALCAGLAMGCFPTDEAKNATLEEPCSDNDECVPGQECVRTAAERAAGFPGVCLSEGSSCLVGEQIGCACNVASTTPCVKANHYGIVNAAFDVACDDATVTCVLTAPSGDTGDADELELESSVDTPPDLPQ